MQYKSPCGLVQQTKDVLSADPLIVEGGGRSRCD